MLFLKDLFREQTNKQLKRNDFRKGKCTSTKNFTITVAWAAKTPSFVSVVFHIRERIKIKQIKSKSAWRYLKRYLHVCEFKLLCSPGLIILINLFILKLLFWSQLVIYSVILVWGVQFSDILIYFSTKIVLEMMFNFFNYIESGK